MNPLNELLENNAVRIAVIGALAILALYLFAKTWATVDGIGQVDTSNLATITVSGEGKSSAAPTIATVSFTVEQSAAAVADAQAAATKQTDTVLAAVKALGVADADVQTEGYNVTPQYATPSCPPGVFCPGNTGKVTGYDVSQTVDVKVRDTSKVGDVLQALGTAGVQNISGPNFAVDDSSAVDADARGKAIADAKSKAQVLAEQLGVKLGHVVGFSENDGGTIVPMYGIAGGVALAPTAVPAPTIPTGTNETDVSVSVTYEIH